MSSLFRFSNAVSDITKFIQTYRCLYAHFGNLPKNQYFDHDDAAEFLALNGLASSQGAVGEVALQRSRRPDRSRDPLYNQHKMYSEIYRMLGWYEPATRQTCFRMAEFGQYIYESKGEEERNLFALNTLHIASPNQMTEVKGQNVLRPFPMILKLAQRLDGYICRDEIILGVLACANDRQNDVLDQTAQRIARIRRCGKTALDNEITILNKENGYSTPATSQNYTRFPIAAMKWNGWAEGMSTNTIYKNVSVKFLKLTNEGVLLAKKLENTIDVRFEDIVRYSPREQAAFVAWSNMHQLSKLGYDLGEYSFIKEKLYQISSKIMTAFKINDDSDLLFFGYQESPRSLLKYSDELMESL